MVYTDDTQLYITVKARCDPLQLCIIDIFTWCTKNGLACSLDTTEVAHLRSCHAKNFNPIQEIVIGDVVIVPKPVVRDLGLLIDSHLLLKNQVNQVCRCAWSAIRKIGRIRSHLTQDVCERLVHAFITSKLDSCNSFLYGLPSCELVKLRVQNAAARLVTMASKSDHVTPILFKIHWLPVKERITFKLLLIIFKALHGQAPSYIDELLNIYQPSRSLRSSSLKYLSVPKCNTVSCGHRAFSVASAKLWNSRPYYLKFTENINTFKTSLKTLLFKRTFNLH